MKIKMKKLFSIKNFVPFVGIVLFCLFILPVFTGILNIGNTVGMVLSAIIFLVSAFWSLFKIIISKLWSNIITRIFIILISIVLMFSIVCGLILTGFMIRAATNTPPQNKTVIVLGCKVKGTVPSIMLKSRLNCAYEYLQDNPQSKCIVSGGQGVKEDIPEAQAMFNYLVEKGISPNRLYVESVSADTEENIKFSKKIMDENNLGNEVVIATDGFHELRASILAKKEGLTPYAAASWTRLFLFPTYYMRELFGLMEQIVLK